MQLQRTVDHQRDRFGGALAVDALHDALVLAGVVELDVRDLEDALPGQIAEHRFRRYLEAAEPLPRVDERQVRRALAVREALERDVVAAQWRRRNHRRKLVRDVRLVHRIH